MNHFIRMAGMKTWVILDNTLKLQPYLFAQFIFLPAEFK